MDAEKFAEGGYMVYQRCPEWINVTFDKEEEELVHAGDHVKITFWDDRADQYIKKELIVMAVIACTDPYGTFNIQHGNIVLNDEDFISIYSGYEDFVTKICFDSKAKAVETGALALRKEKERYDAVREVI